MSSGTDRIEIRNLNPASDYTDSLKSPQPFPELDSTSRNIPVRAEQQEQPQFSRDNVKFIRQNPSAGSQLAPIARPGSPSSNLRIKGGEQCCRNSDVDSHIRSSLDDVRALRVVELVNDYRSLLIHIMEHTRSISLGYATQYGYKVLRHNHAAAQRLLASNYRPAVVSTHSEEEQTAQLRQIIIDASARRHQAHKIYLRVAAAKRWVFNHNYVVSKFKAHELAVQLRDIDGILHNEITNTSDQHVASDLRDANERAGYWVNGDPPLPSVQFWIRLELWDEYS